MSNYKSLIDEAMKTAQYRLSAGVEKTASISNDDSLIKEANELANALEYMSVTSANDGSLAGQARAEMVRDFYKAATAQRLGVKLAGDVGEGPTMVSGEQAIAPNSGKIKLMPKKEVAGNPMVSAAPDSKGKTMLESFKQADSAGKSLYDILMHNKEAGDVGEMSASEPAQGIPSSNENSNRSILKDYESITKQEAKAPVRDRLREAFSATGDTLGDQTLKGMFPAAYQASGLKKTASINKKAGSFVRMTGELAKKRSPLLETVVKGENRMAQEFLGHNHHPTAREAINKIRQNPQFNRGNVIRDMDRKAKGAMQEAGYSSNRYGNNPEGLSWKEMSKRQKGEIKTKQRSENVFRDRRLKAMGLI